jgi:hypothetical protein
MLTFGKIHSVKTHSVPPLLPEMKYEAFSMTIKQNDKARSRETLAHLPQKVMLSH